MSYSGRKKFNTAREKNIQAFKNMKMAFAILIITIIVLSIMNRVSLIDYLKTYFY